MKFLLWRKRKKGPKSEKPIEKLLAEIEGLIEECQSVSDEELALLEGKSKVIVVRPGFRSGSVIALSIVFLLAGVGLGLWLGGYSKNTAAIPPAMGISKQVLPTASEMVIATEGPTVVPKPSLAPKMISQPNGLDSLALEAQALKKRVQEMK